MIDVLRALVVLQRLLGDNGSALNPSGEGASTNSSRKNERFRQYLFRGLDNQPLADTLVVVSVQSHATLVVIRAVLILVDSG